MQQRERINIRIVKASVSGLVKVTWVDANGLEFRPYHLYVAQVQNCADKTRVALDGLAAAWRAEGDFTSAVDALAVAGQELRDALFLDCPPEDREVANEVRDWLDWLTQTAPGLTITVHADPILSVPWGLLHEPAAADPVDGFWAPRYEVAVLYHGMRPRRSGARAIQGVRLISALNQEVFEGTCANLDDGTRAFVAAQTEREVGPAFSRSGCGTRWGQVGQNDCVMYFLGHATGSGLHFANDDVLSARDFRSLFRRERCAAPSAEPPYVLSVLNGCSSVAGIDADSFLVATADPGFCGFIGAEHVVPDRFALLFGAELLHALLDQGQSVREAMARLWRKHRPMGLFFGCYAAPDFRIAPVPSPPRLPATFGSPNFLASPSASS